MWLLFFIYLGALQIILNCYGLKYIDVENHNYEDKKEIYSDVSQYDSIRGTNSLEKKTEGRRNLPGLDNIHLRNPPKSPNNNEEDKDEKLKSKISTLVEQTVHDTTGKVESLASIKDQLRKEYPYQIGFVLSMIKKSKEVLDELFNIAVKHKDDWKALEQLKVFELIVHTNVDSTHLVRQLYEIHVQYMNSTRPDGPRNRVMLLK